MKKIDETIPKNNSTDFSDLKKLINQNFEEMNKRLDNLQRDIKIVDQKVQNEADNVRFEFKTSLFERMKDLEKTVRAEIQVSINESEQKMKNFIQEVEKRINTRIQTVGDLITIDFAKKIENLKKRIQKLENS